MARSTADIELAAQQLTPMHWLGINRNLGTTTQEVMEDAVLMMSVVAAYLDWDESGRRGTLPIDKWVNTSLNELIEFLGLEEEEAESPKESEPKTPTSGN